MANEKKAGKRVDPEKTKPGKAQKDRTSQKGSGKEIEGGILIHQAAKRRVTQT